MELREAYDSDWTSTQSYESPGEKLFEQERVVLKIGPTLEAWEG